MLAKFHHELGPKGLVVLGIAMDEHASNEVPSGVDRFIKTLHVPYAIALSAPMSQMVYGMEGLPTTLLIDRNGRKARVYVGAIRETEFRADVEALLQEPAPWNND